MAKTFVPGFGCSISQAIQSSCSATPFFSPCVLTLENSGTVEARDGGFSANNPSLFALTDALGPLGSTKEKIRILSVGVGHYPDPKKGIFKNAINKMIQKVPSVHLLQKTLSCNAATTETLIRLLFPDVAQFRINERFQAPELAMDFLETDLKKLNLLLQKGRESFSLNELELRKFFDNYHQD
ncbi:MAG: hypothetical protein EOP06_09500 [Proteobacteria bacterium]|nr:MAG: hypothetical protein EOP06_09500 [Pseudomonadota bacterium]